MEAVDKILGFLTQIGIRYQLEQIDTPTFLPGLKLQSGTLVIDQEKLLYPGDILHEAGHLACFPSEIRETMTDVLENNSQNQGNEMMAIAWSFAACVHLNIDPAVVFHPQGYKGQSAFLINHYNNGGTIGVPLLQWCGMAYDYATAARLNENPFPYMVNWVCKTNPYINEEQTA